jgi:hypothetical protein
MISNEVTNTRFTDIFNCQTTTWVVSGHDSVTKGKDISRAFMFGEMFRLIPRVLEGIIVCSYFFVISFAMTWG